ncbi:MAG: GerMN domain-containing protein [Clostridiales bacterium]|jgi:germination protein M|nr:GerMN domain-containing protein [Clostridiales bacterium]
MTKKSVPYITVIGIILIGILVFVFVFFLDTKAHDNTRVTARIYYRTDLDTIDYEEYPVQIQEKEKMASYVFDKFAAGRPQNPNLHKTTPDDLSIIEPLIIRLAPERSDYIFVVDFTKDYYNMQPIDEMFFRAALIWTMTDLDFINNVEIRVDGEELRNSLGVVMGSLNRINIDIHPIISPIKTVSRTVKLYFTDETGAKLLPEERTIDVNPDLPIGQFIMEQLILGPRQEGHFPTVSADVKIRDMQYQDGICFVNLSSDFLSKSPASSAADEVTVYSVVNSLTEVTQVRKVQFLIESAIVTQLKGNMDLSRQFERNEGLNP